MKIGLFFGSFNPIHVGHLIIGNTMAETTDLDEVWYVVSPQNPFKKNQSLLHEFDRFDMVTAAIANNPKFRASDIEFSLPKPSYTVDTLTYISDKYPQHSFVLIIGEDNLDQFTNWKNHEQILHHYSLYVYPRPDSSNSFLREHKNVRLVAAPLLEISATYIRNLVKQEKSIRYLVSKEVEELILSRKYYSNY
ncbi:nicotinate (nicotinamide) nucleotide adenylyltransferase [Cytophaga hutchinsonii]|jgi:nicotinate-nucleotide adenylyltransferase|uniref:Probable nicotinate-nucleotide adenylyltransferase n=1 Tax=Cytophaga hutchinsonii (strain ATCC 33406 / DSM 1761 / CIP 103989 / NBRC 15051 / NCIMB 9469 / D465) TaxID=269798 RepID=NADD_CYTH3|nr:nicotinate (nicotinamide) nucleotide adenylyltransferase [Cytophaga hutchinsonii]Q11XI1.1 RecName: Full=Probable nicotinate-nucleotide adenylyltransferase; AltName: Full=Deamido-NAD(+) diphosphorylase; AltName: Full=Deamido-NAD(+) pyrophosphorylase; AltName: Full=Nicotinate mononucleotide adenylyltransferase; Short=NaMN adenylyltransferase [Cytophaga hutchinsonii ATCC 33406]ABG57885.1 nicotinate-nucleotide adenylyltransferase [Cytophaga hutchinsonii ATCC 33406]SFX08145.1 nicotinate-nucleotide